ncbi:MAG: T9SS type A sorting domain-containing protein, partial [Ignavibacteriales bacterium]|nr:T9SS type A sorting domain-containing protein [Ignavibacteriales bacterium]
NPFNPSTRVDLSLPVDSRVSVTIFNSLGQKVQQIDAGQLSAGYHHINFDMAGFSSGVYYYHILAGENNYSGRMMLLK